MKKYDMLTFYIFIVNLLIILLLLLIGPNRDQIPAQSGWNFLISLSRGSPGDQFRTPLKPICIILRSAVRGVSGDIIGAP